MKTKKSEPGSISLEGEKNKHNIVQYGFVVVFLRVLPVLPAFLLNSLNKYNNESY